MLFLFLFFIPATHFAIGSLSFESEITKCRTYGGKEEEMSQRSLGILDQH